MKNLVSYGNYSAIIVLERNDNPLATRCAYDRIFWPLSCDSRRRHTFHKYTIVRLLTNKHREALETLRKRLSDDIFGAKKRSIK